MANARGSIPALDSTSVDYKAAGKVRCSTEAAANAHCTERPLAFPAIERALKRRAAVAALQQRPAEAPGSSNSSTYSKLAVTNRAATADSSSNSTHARSGPMPWPDAGSDELTDSSKLQQVRGAASLPDQLPAKPRLQTAPTQACRKHGSHTSSQESASTLAAPATQQLCSSAAADAVMPAPSAACRTSTPTAHSTRGFSGEALAAELQLVRSWRLRRHAAACVLQAAVRSWLARKHAQHHSRARRLQLHKARRILTAWREQVMYRQNSWSLIVQRLRGGCARGQQLWLQVQQPYASEGRHACAAAFHRHRVQSGVLLAWASATAGASHQPALKG